MHHTVGNKYKTSDGLISLLSTFQLNAIDYCVLITIGSVDEPEYKGFNGNRYFDPVAVDNPYNMTEVEMLKLTRNQSLELYTKSISI
jgi:hypothetical protein